MNAYHLKYLPISLISFGTLLASVIFPLIGNPIAMCIGTTVLFLATGFGMRLTYLLIGTAFGQLPLLMAQGFHLTQSNTLCVVASLIAWVIGLVAGKRYG